MKKTTFLHPAGIFATSLVASLFSLSSLIAQTPTDDAASPETPQVASEPKYPEFYNDEKYAIYRDPRYAKPLPEGIFGVRTISVPEDGFHNDQDRELYVGLKGVADVLSQAQSFDGLLQKLAPYSKAIFGEETTDNDSSASPRFAAVVYQAPSFLLRTAAKPSSSVVIVSHVDGYILFHYNRGPRGYWKPEQIEENGNWQTGEIFEIDVFYFDRRDAIQATFFSNGSPELLTRSEFAQAPTTLCVPNRIAKKKGETSDAFAQAFQREFPTRFLYSTRWDKNGSVAERVDEPIDVKKTFSFRKGSTEVFTFQLDGEKAPAKETASEKTE
ncbi:MAG: hypothetical protein IJE97_11480 [Thermoguttaceae bacterium]|nr:hypothetical protein [Thermoguttaceae bacterium]MBQ7111406.1 hypothetical protein [Thermoguttaceae bacterium]